MFFASEEDGGGKNSFESLDDATIMAAVLRHSEEAQQVGVTVEVGLASLLL